MRFTIAFCAHTFNSCLALCVARIVPLDQIHSLEPSLQPRAWLDVMASANTTREEKNEGMEEILILAKDKVRVFVSFFVVWCLIGVDVVIS